MLGAGRGPLAPAGCSYAALAPPRLDSVQHGSSQQEHASTLPGSTVAGVQATQACRAQAASGLPFPAPGRMLSARSWLRRVAGSRRRGVELERDCRAALRRAVAPVCLCRRDLPMGMGDRRLDRVSLPRLGLGL